MASSCPSLSNIQVKEITEICQDALQGSVVLTAWEKQFCTNILARLNQWDTYTQVSDAQWKAIKDIEIKVYYDGR